MASASLWWMIDAHKNLIDPRSQMVENVLAVSGSHAQPLTDMGVSTMLGVRGGIVE